MPGQRHPDDMCDKVQVGLVLGLLAASACCDALRMINLEAPEWALQGDTIQLSCFFALANVSQLDKSKLAVPGEPAGELELLYAIKWYKDGREFFRYLAQDWPKRQALPRPGLTVNVDKSDNHTVVLHNVTLETSGLFKCEVSTDLPSFITKFIERRLAVYALPSTGPVIETPVARDSRASLGDRLDFSCMAPESKPPAILDWIINEKLNLSAHEWTDPLHPLKFSMESGSRLRLPGSQSGRSARNLFELQPNGLATPVGHPDSTPLNLSERLDHLAVMSTTRLDLTADSNLFGALRLFHPAQSVNSSASSRIPARQASSPSFNNPRWKLSKAQSRTESIQLRVRCVARVLHLSLSDEIKIKLVNQTLDERPSGSAEPKMLKRLGSNSASTNSFLTQLLVTIIYGFASLLLWFQIVLGN